MRHWSMAAAHQAKYTDESNREKMRNDVSIFPDPSQWNFPVTLLGLYGYHLFILIRRLAFRRYSIFY